MNRLPIVCFSHLRWDFVYQRPQHVMSRLALQRDVLFVEEPIVDPAESPGLEIRDVAPRVRVCRPHLPVAGTGIGAEQEPMLTALLVSLLHEEQWLDFAAWLYTPMAVRSARAIEPRVAVYDCMDELSAFAHAPPELVARERELLAWADLVFTGGPSLYRAKKHLHPSVHCFPSSVDVEHFAGTGTDADPDDQADLPHPRLGYYGVIDERLDLDLIDTLAAGTDGQVVLVGPVAKISESSLPRRDNLHYLGMKPYASLPSYVGGWDVCLMPFAIGRATQFISPTKVLEYMAADRPIVSTPIADVRDHYADIVYLADGPDAFVSACAAALLAPPEDREARRSRAQAVLAKTSWVHTVERMSGLVDEVVDARFGLHTLPTPGSEARADLTGRSA
jgi:UDP-galactopyranose mutase